LGGGKRNGRRRQIFKKLERKRRAFLREVEAKGSEGRGRMIRGE